MPEVLVTVPGMLCTDDLWRDALRHAGVARVHPATIEGESVDEAVAHLLDRAPARFALAGLSLGGTVALAVARTAPARVARLALLSTNPRPPRPEQRASWLAAVSRLDDGASPGDEQRRLLPHLVGPVLPERRALLEQRVVAMADDTGAPALRRQLAVQASRVDERPTLAALRCPTLVVAAADDALCTLDQHEELATGIPGAVLEVLGATGHLSPLERPEQVGALLSAWMSR